MEVPMAHNGPVTSQQSAQAAYQAKVAAGAGKWAAGCQSYQGNLTPMQMAAAKQQEAVAGYTRVVGGGQWAANLNAMPIAAWKNPTTANSAGAQKYAMAKG